MKRVSLFPSVAIATLLFVPLAISQNTDGPRLVKFGGVVRDDAGKAMVGTINITFCLYDTEKGGTGLWMERQNVDVDSDGEFEVDLGANSSDGLPESLFPKGEPRWLGIQPEGQDEARILMMNGSRETLRAMMPSVPVTSN
jgi:hypothetical protein